MVPPADQVGRAGDYDAHLIRPFIPRPAQDVYAAVRSLNLELVRLPELVSNPTMARLRLQFWKDSIEATFSGRPPREPVCLLLHQGLDELQNRAGSAARKPLKFWLARLLKTRADCIDNRPFTSLAHLEDYAEKTYSAMMYATLAALPLQSVQMDHLASHIGKACGIVAVLRGIRVLAAPAGPPGRQPLAAREPCLLLPLDVMAEKGLQEELVFRQGPAAPGFRDAVFTVATRANDHLLTARHMWDRLKEGAAPDHDFEHQGEAGHLYDEPTEAAGGREMQRAFGLFLEAVPAGQYLAKLEKADFDPFSVPSGGWRLPWRIWQALSKQRL